MRQHESLSFGDTQPGPEPNQPTPEPDGTPEEFPFTEPKQYPIHPEIPTQPIHEPSPRIIDG